MNEPSAKEGIHSLFDLYANDIYRYARFTLQDHAEAKDVVQEVFLRAFRQWDRFRQESSYKTWLLSITRNYMYDLLRKRKKHSTFLDTYTPPYFSDPTSTTDDLIVLEQSLAKLKDAYRQVIVLRHVEGLSVSQVAEILDWSEGKVRTTLHRALKQLRDEMGDAQAFQIREERG
ncbi:MAG: RNA polymerase sigma factor [Tumebacillaceae bacterium]